MQSAAHLAAFSTTTPMSASNTMTKSAKRRLKRQRAIAAASSEVIHSNGSALPSEVEPDDAQSEPEAKKSKQDSVSIATAPTANTSVPLSFNQALEAITTTCQECLQLMPAINKYFVLTHSIPTSSATASSTTAATAAVNTEHACLKKIRLFVRASIHGWKQVSAIQVDHAFGLEKKLSEADVKVTLRGFGGNFLTIFRFLIIILQHLLVQHVEVILKALTAAATKKNASSSSSSAALSFTEDDASILSQTVLKKDSPLRMTKRIIDHIYGDLFYANDTQSVVHVALLGGPDQSTSATLKLFTHEYQQYEYLLFQASNTCEQITAGSRISGPIRLPLQSPPDGLSSSFPPSLTAKVDDEASALLNHCMIQTPADLQQIQLFCLQSLNLVDENKFASALASLPPIPSVHSRLRFLRSVLRLIRSTLKLSEAQVTLQVYGSFICGTATSNDSDLDAQIVFRETVDRGTGGDPVDWAREQLNQVRHALKRRSLWVDGGRLNARTPIIAIRKSTTSTTTATSSSKSTTTSSEWLAPCDCDIGVIHEADFLQAEWYTNHFTRQTPACFVMPGGFHPTPNVLKSLYLSRYLFMDKRIRKVFVVLRKWYSERQLNSAQDSTLSSFSWTILLIHALQVMPSPVLPMLIPSAETCAQIITGSNVCFMEIGTAASPMPIKKDVTTLDLLAHFFHYYSAYHLHLSIDITGSSSPTGVSNLNLPPTVPLQLHDPIQPDENTARSMNSPHNWHRIRRECQRAMWLLKEEAEQHQIRDTASTSTSSSTSSSSTSSILTALTRPTLPVTPPVGVTSSSWWPSLSPLFY